jgi:hypothetical protein
MEKPVMRPEFWADLGSACPHGTQSPELVRAWFKLKWPVYQTYRYRNHKRAIANWWSRVGSRELDQAREYLEATRDQQDSARLNSLAEELNAPRTVDPPTRRFAVLDGGRRRG